MSSLSVNVFAPVSGIVPKFAMSSYIDGNVEFDRWEWIRLVEVRASLAHVPCGIPPSSHIGGVDLTEKRKEIGSFSLGSPYRALTELGGL